MAKLVQRMKGSLVNIGSVESWLSDMAADGLMLSEVVGFKAYFKKCSPQKVEYRLKMFDYYPKDPDVKIEENRTAYDELGWEFVSRYNNVHIFRNTKKDFDEPELNEDESKYRLQKLNQRYYLILLTGLFALAYLVAGLATNSFTMILGMIDIMSIIIVFAAVTIWACVSYFLYRRVLLKIISLITRNGELLN